MPELPEVETMALDLRADLVGATVKDAWIILPRLLVEPSDPRQWQDALRGLTLLAIRRRGKRLLFDFTHEYTLLFAPRMTGRPYLVSDASLDRDRHDHAGLTFTDGRELRLQDPRTFARLGLYRRLADGSLRDTAGKDPLAHLGPEPLADTFTPAELALRLSRSSARPLKASLLDQACVAGIGNIYADESLWAARLHPLRPSGSLTPAENTRLHAAIVALLTAGVAARGTQLRDYDPPHGGASMQKQLRAYGRAGHPCSRCGTPLASCRVGGRGTTFCPDCQLTDGSQGERKVGSVAGTP